MGMVLLQFAASMLQLLTGRECELQLESTLETQLGNAGPWDRILATGTLASTWVFALTVAAPQVYNNEMEGYVGLVGLAFVDLSLFPRSMCMMRLPSTMY